MLLGLVKKLAAKEFCRDIAVRKFCKENEVLSLLEKCGGASSSCALIMVS